MQFFNDQSFEEVFVNVKSLRLKYKEEMFKLFVKGPENMSDYDYVTFFEDC